MLYQMNNRFLYASARDLRGKGAVLANLRLGLLAVGALAASSWPWMMGNTKVGHGLAGPEIRLPTKSWG